MNQPAAPAKPKPRLLVVDDDACICDLVERGAARLGFDVTIVSDGRRAERLLAETRFDVLLTDIYMPESDGLEVIRKTHLLQPALVIVAMSGGCSFGFNFLRTAQLLGATRVLEKPFDLAALKELLQPFAGATIASANAESASSCG